MPAPVASGWSESPGGACTHWKAPPCHGAPPFRPLPALALMAEAVKGCDRLMTPSRPAWFALQRRDLAPTSSASAPGERARSRFSSGSSFAVNIGPCSVVIALTGSLDDHGLCCVSIARSRPSVSQKRTNRNPPLVSRSKPSARRSEMGHEDQFPSPRPSDRCRFSQKTFGSPSGNGRGAPSAVIPALAPERGSSTLSGPSARGMKGTPANPDFADAATL
jgi:hypothetical protein